MTGDAPGRADEGEEIDRIMKEIEDLEKKMDTGAPEPAEAAAAPAASAESAEEAEAEEAEAESPFGAETGKVVPMRHAAAPVAESLAETDAVPPRNEPLMRASNDAGDSGLSMKIGGCTEVNLEFTRSGITVALSCNEDALVITTDQGAEFKIPFKRSA